MLLWPAASGHHLGAANEEARINAQGPANQAEHHDCANTNAAAGYTDAASILNPRALRQLIEAHDVTSARLSVLSNLASKSAGKCAKDSPVNPHSHPVYFDPDQGS